jgi:hypothetical protein
MRAEFWNSLHRQIDKRNLNQHMKPEISEEKPLLELSHTDSVNQPLPLSDSEAYGVGRLNLSFDRC